MILGKSVPISVTKGLAELKPQQLGNVSDKLGVLGVV